MKSFQALVIYITLFIAFCGFSSIHLNINGWSSRESFYIGSFLLLLCLALRKEFCKGEMSSVVNWTLLSASLSIIPAFFDWNARIESFIYGFITTYYGFLFYYLLRIWKLSPNEIMRIVCFFCIIWVIIEIGQQFTYPQYWFLGSRNDTGFIQNRMGLWRFYIWGVDFVMIAFSYYAGKLFDGTVANKKLIYTILFAVGIFCYCSRKHIIAILAVCAYGILKTNSKHKWSIRFLSILLLALLFINFYADFSEMNADAIEKQGEGEDFIRYLAALFYINDFSDSVLYPIFGTGWGSDILENRLEYCTDVLRFFRADIGILGYYSTVGLVGVSAILYYIFKVVKNWKYIDLSYRMFFIMKLILIIFDFWMMWAIGIIAYGTFLYLLEENIKHNKTKIYEHRNINVLQSC